MEDTLNDEDADYEAALRQQVQPGQTPGQASSAPQRVTSGLTYVNGIAVRPKKKTIPRATGPYAKSSELFFKFFVLHVQVH